MKIEVYCDLCHKYQKTSNISVEGFPFSDDPEQPQDRSASIKLTLSLSCGHTFHISFKGESCLEHPRKSEEK
jgi:hypothetical protein